MQFDPPRSRSENERILPLIDVVLLLLIFVMLTGQLVEIDPITAEPPRSASTGMAGTGELAIVIGAGSELALDGQLIDRAALHDAVAKKLIGNAAPQVWLKADGGAESIQVIAIMDILREAGVERLKLLTTPAEE